MNMVSNWLKEMSQNIATLSFFQLLMDTLKIFFQAEDGKEVGKKTASVSVGYAIYKFMDWKVVAIVGVSVVWMVEMGLEKLEIFLILWAASIPFSLLIIFANDRLGIDFTFAEGQRRIVDKLHAQSKVLGYLFECLGGLVHLAWSGMPQFAIFFRGKLKNPLAKILLFVLFSGIQMYIWTRVYLLGVGFFKCLRSLFFS